jgi:hypothetical protein
MKSNRNRGPAVAMDSAIGMSCPQIIFRTGVRAMISMFVFLFPFVVNAAELQQQTVKAWGTYVQDALPHAAAASTRRPTFSGSTRSRIGLAGSVTERFWCRRLAPHPEESAVRVNP